MNRVLLIGENPNGPTGNGLMMLGVINQIDPTTNEVSVFCPCSDFAPDLSDLPSIKIIPSDDVKRNDIWGSHKLLALVDSNDLDFVIMVGIDIWRYIDIISHLKQMQSRKKFKLIHIFPYDLCYLDQEFVQYARAIDFPCVYSRYGFDILKDAVPHIQYYRPSMPFMDLFFPYDKEQKLAARSSLFPTVSPETLIFGFIGPNQIRKDPQKLIKAFSLVKSRVKRKIVLYMHTSFKEGVFNLQHYAMSCGLSSGDLLIKPEGAFSPFEKMPDIFNALDFFVNCSMQEGLSWTSLQALLCGVPIILSKSTAHIELITEPGMGDLIECENETYLPIKTVNGQRWVEAKSCSASDIADSMEYFVENYDKDIVMFEKDRVQKRHQWVVDWFSKSSDINGLFQKPANIEVKQLLPAILFMQHSSAGDVLMTTRCLANLRNKHSNMPLHYMTQDKFAGILDRNPNVDKILPWNPELRKTYQVVYNPHGEHILRGGFNNLDIKLADMYPYFCKVEPTDFFIHCQKPEIQLPDHYVLVHTTGGDPQFRTYAHMGLVTRGLTLPVVQIGLTTDLYCPGAIDLRGLLTFTEIAWVMKNALAAIVIDSFPSHLGGAVGTPCIVLYGPAPARVVGPVHTKVPDNLWFDMEPNKLDVCPDMTNCHGQKRNCQSPCINSINPMSIKKNLVSILSQVVKDEGV